MPENLIEHVAKAIWEDDHDDDLTWDDPKVYQDHYRSLAQAAIRAHNDFLETNT